MRKRININQEWVFIKAATDIENIKNTSNETVHIPHTWNAIDGQDGGNDYYRGTCWYAKSLPYPEIEPGQRVWLEFQGVAMTADIYVNKVNVCHHEGGYSTFRVDITEELKEVNEISVAVDNSVNDRVYPQKADFTFYGGIYRDVNLMIVDEAHFSLEPYGTSGIKVTPEIWGEDAKIHIETIVTGDADKAVFTVSETGEKVVCQLEKGIGEAIIQIQKVRKWSGKKDPYLYTLKAELFRKGRVVDDVETRFGCRVFSFDPEQGFRLNGERYPLHGVSRHQDRKNVGNALSREMHKEDMEIICEMGANTIRLAHYQHDQYFYDLCDEYGLVVWAEIPYITKHMDNGCENAMGQMKELITQCYHHPSIICWGLSNEITASGEANETIIDNHRVLNDLCHELDQTRVTALASVFMLEPENPLNHITDILSYNLYFGWYLGELEQNDQWFDAFHERFPDRCIGFSEYGADANPCFQTEVPERGDYTEQYQVIYHEHILNMLMQRPYIWASHVWNMFDFAADGRDEGGEHGINQKGLVTFDRKIKKDAFYLYKAHWSEEPFVHICGKRYVDREAEMTDVIVYSNQAEVILLRDGDVIERQSGTKKFVFHVQLKGEHCFTAISDDVSDEIIIRKVEEKNLDYQFIKEKIVNWFDKEDLNPEYYSIKDTLGEIKQHPGGEAIINRMIMQASASRGDVAGSTHGNKNLEKMLNQMTVEALLKQAGDAISAEQIKALNDALQKISKKMSHT